VVRSLVVSLAEEQNPGAGQPVERGVFVNRLPVRPQPGSISECLNQDCISRTGL
jgi:hypothetical protein